MTKPKPNNTIGIRAVRAKDWRWWFVSLTGSGERRIAEGFGDSNFAYQTIGCDYHPDTGKRRNLIRKLERALGTKLKWDVVEE